MKEQSLLFAGEMVRATLAGSKTQTRRVPIERYRNWKVGETIWVREGFQICTRYYGSREVVGRYIADNMAFRLTLTRKENDLLEARKYPRRNTPGRFMYKSLARIFLEITGLRDERVQGISEDDAEAEGCDCSWLIHQACDDAHNKRRAEIYQKYGTPVADVRTANEQSEFAWLWDSINAKRHGGIYAWGKNPEVKVIEFKLKGENNVLSTNVEPFSFRPVRNKS